MIVISADGVIDFMITQAHGQARYFVQSVMVKYASGFVESASGED